MSHYLPATTALLDNLNAARTSDFDELLGNDREAKMRRVSPTPSPECHSNTLPRRSDGLAVVPQKVVSVFNS